MQSMLREWSYAQTYRSSVERAAHLPLWLHRYNWHRPHASLNYQPPIRSLNLPSSLSDALSAPTAYDFWERRAAG